MNEKQRLEAVRMIPFDLSVHFSYPENYPISVRLEIAEDPCSQNTSVSDPVMPLVIRKYQRHNNRIASECCRQLPILGTSSDL